jgi:hypothetical protein
VTLAERLEADYRSDAPRAVTFVGALACDRTNIKGLGILWPHENLTARHAEPLARRPGL